MNKDYLVNLNLYRISAMIMIIFYHCICPYGIWSGESSANVFPKEWDIVSEILCYIHLPMFFLLSVFLYSYNSLGGGD